MSERRIYLIQELVELLPAEETFILRCVEEEWLHPAHVVGVQDCGFDEADVARLRLILELRDSFGANEESIPLILHLLDQLHTLHEKLQNGEGHLTSL